MSTLSALKKILGRPEPPSTEREIAASEVRRVLRKTEDLEESASYRERRGVKYREMGLEDEARELELQARARRRAARRIRQTTEGEMAEALGYSRDMEEGHGEPN